MTTALSRRSRSLMWTLALTTVACSDARGAPDAAQPAGDAARPDVPVHVSPCDALPAAGMWERITPPGVSWTNAVMVDPFDPATVWLGAKDHGFMRSDDCGASWAAVSTGRNTDRFNVGNSGVSAVLSPTTPGTIYANNNDGPNGLWRSTNGGVDWDELWPQGGVVASALEYNVPNGIGMLSQDPQHLVVGMHATCKAPHRPVCLAETTDGGDSWRVVDGPASFTGWIAGAAVFMLDADRWLFGTYSSGLWLTENRGDSWKEVTAAGAGGSTSGKTLIRPFERSEVSGAYYLADMQGVLRSEDGLEWTLLPDTHFRTVGLAVGGGHVFAADQWSSSFWVASESDLTHFELIAPPAELGSSAGAPYLAYDAAHHVLYASTWENGLWRIVIQ